MMSTVAITGLLTKGTNPSFISCDFYSTEALLGLIVFENVTTLCGLPCLGHRNSQLALFGLE